MIRCGSSAEKKVSLDDDVSEEGSWSGDERGSASVALDWEPRAFLRHTPCGSVHWRFETKGHIKLVYLFK